MSKRWFVALSVVSMLAWSMPAAAKPGHGQGKGKGKAEKSEHAKEKSKDEKHETKHEEKAEQHAHGKSRAVVTRVHVAPPPRPVPPVIVRHTPPRPVAAPVLVIDRDGYRRVVTQYFTRESLPPGLAGRPLPPGLAKQLRERGHLPPGLQKRLIAVPAPLVSQMPALPPYYGRYFAGRDLVLLDSRTNTVVGVVRDVVVVHQ